MKKTFLSLFVLLAFTVSAHAADTKSVNIWVNPIGGGVFLNGGLDIKMGNNTTLGPAFYSINLSASGLNTGIKSTGYGAYLRYYFSNAIASSWRFSGFGYYMPVTYTSGTYSGTATSFLAGALFGYHWVPGIINLGIDLGGAYFTGGSTVTLTNGAGATQSSSVTVYGFLPALEITLGLAF